MVEAIDLQKARAQLSSKLSQEELRNVVAFSDSSLHAKKILTAVVMLMGYPHPSDATIKIVLEKQGMIDKIIQRQPHHIKTRRKRRVRHFIEFQPSTFGQVAGYQVHFLFFMIVILFFFENKKNCNLLFFFSLETKWNTQMESQKNV